MRHLYIIGNGFDIYTGLATRYSDFRRWLENNNPFIYESMQAVYDIDAEWWNDFEEQLGLLDIKKYVKKFTPPSKTIAEIRAEIEQRKKIENKQGDGMPSHNYHCAKRLKGLLDALQYFLRNGWRSSSELLLILNIFILRQKIHSSSISIIQMY